MPRNYDRGCISYLTMDYVMRISFPSEMVICDLCPFCHTENSGTRFRCTETGEILPYHNKDIGLRCPLSDFINEAKAESEEEEK